MNSNGSQGAIQGPFSGDLYDDLIRLFLSLIFHGHYYMTLAGYFAWHISLRSLDIP